MRKITLLIAMLCLANRLAAQEKQECRSEYLLNELHSIQYREQSNLLFHYFIKSCITDTIRNKILGVLKGEWNDAELTEYIKKNSAGWHNRKFFEGDIRKIIQKDTSRFEAVYDSLIQVRLNKQKQQMLTHKIPDDVILLCGYLYLEEAKPVLYQALNHPQKYNREAVEFALARFGDQKYYTKFLNKGKGMAKDLTDLQKRSTILIYLATQESIYELAKNLSNTIEFNPTYGDDSTAKTTLGFFTSSFLLYRIKNPDLMSYFKTKYRYVPMYYEMQNEDIAFIKKWMEANKGHYEFDKNP